MTNRKKTGNLPIVIDPYYWLVYVTVGEGELDALAEEGVICRTDFDVSGCEGKAWLLEAGGGDFSLIYIKDKKDVYTIIHECVHVVHEMMKSRAIPLTHDNTEVIAYHVEHLVQAVVQRVQ